MKRAWLLTAAALLLAGPAYAQLSPGELSRAHAGLEGNTQCLSCHEAKRGVAPDKCLTCHTALRGRVAAGKGLHAQPGYTACGRCHVEHQGRSFDLIFWGKTGRAAFDHKLTGFPLEGPHAKPTCQACHAPRRIQDGAKLSQGGVNLARTYLGLSRECATCHADPHRGRLTPCTSCHALDAWKPAPGFDHARTKFPLVGEHRKVGCDSCHKTDPATGRRQLAGVPFETCKSCHADPHAGALGAACASCHSPEGWRAARTSFDHARTKFPLTGEHRTIGCERCHTPARPGGAPRYKGLPFLTCASCHKDPHAGQMGPACATCHKTTGWQSARASFDHSKTGYPLQGKHAAVRCASCHKPGAPKRPAHAACTDCHADRHAGQLARKPGGARCERCHDVAGFESPRFTIEDHEQTSFPLTGGHRAIPCTDCHKEVPVARLRQAGLASGTGTGTTEQLRFASTACTSCHDDPHGGVPSRLTKGGDCRTCHTTESWKRVRFDHAATGFPLVGSHATVDCVRCHSQGKQVRPGHVRFVGAPATCAGCHRDPHGGRFAVKGVTACERCHKPTRWSDQQFDHDRETRFALAGAHKRVPCASCHRTRDGKARYTGLPLTCAGCHGGGS